jgi:hypothetical protein
VDNLATLQREYLALQGVEHLSFIDKVLQPAGPTAVRSDGQVPFLCAEQSAALNTSQRLAIGAALGRTPGFTLIQGPPVRPHTYTH